MENRIQLLENLVDLLIEKNSIQFEMLKMHMVWIQRLFDAAESNDEFHKHVARFVELDLKVTEIERKELN